MRRFFVFQDLDLVNMCEYRSENLKETQSNCTTEKESMCLPAALGDGLINGLVNLLVVVVLVSGVLPHVRLE